jgi:hypothetical protein
MALPVSTNLYSFSASVMNDYSAALLAAYDWALGPQFPFGATHSEDSWSGFILHTKDLFRYRFNKIKAGTTTITLNGSTILTDANTGIRAGTVDISGLSLTVGAVYAIEVSVDTGFVSVLWLGESATINYTAPPAFVDTNFEPTAAQLETLRTGISEIESALAWPLPPVITARVKEECEGYNANVRVCDFAFFFAGHELLNYKFNHDTRGNEVHSKLYLNSTSVYDVGEHSGGTHADDVNISALSLSAGTIYQGYMTVEHDGSANQAQVSNTFWLASLESATACTPPPVWAHGGTNITAANLNRYSTIIKAIHPAAPAPTLPLYYEQPAVLTAETHEYYLQHRRRWLRYKGTGATVTIRYGPNLGTKADVASGSTAHASYDLGQLPGLTVGSYYKVEDVHYCQEWTASQ